MGDYLALAGRFSSHQLIAAIGELAAAGPVERYGGWGTAWCYGTLLEVVRAGRRLPGEPEPPARLPAGSRAGSSRPAPVRARFEDCFSDDSYDNLRDTRPDVAVVRLTDREEMPSRQRELQPFLRQESPRPQAFCAPGRLRDPRSLDVGRRITDSSNPDERFFLHALDSLDDRSLLESVTAMHERLAGEPDQRFMLLNTKLLLVSTWQEPVEDRPPLWLGCSDLLRVLSPLRLQSIGELEWEPVPCRTVMVIKRRRYEAGQTG